jgi:hypothetical protein
LFYTERLTSNRAAALTAISLHGQLGYESLNQQHDHCMTGTPIIIKAMTKPPPPPTHEIRV